MEESIEKRLSALEERVGISKAPMNNVHDEIAALRKKLTEAGYGFLLKIPKETIQKLNDLALGDDYLSVDDKKREIEFSYDLTVERAKLLEQFDADSKIVFKSEPFVKVADNMPALAEAEKELEKTAPEVQKHLKEMREMKRNFVILVDQINRHIMSLNNMIDEFEKKKENETKA